MNEQFNSRMRSMVDSAVPVTGQTAESLCLKLFADQTDNIANLEGADRQKAEERIGGFGIFLTKSPALFNIFSDKVASVLSIKRSQLNQLMKQARKKMRDSMNTSTIVSGTTENIEKELSSESSRLKEELFKIYQLPLPVEQKHEQITAAVMSWLTDNGSFYYHIDEQNFKHCLYFDNRRKKLLLIVSDEFMSGLSQLSGINMSRSLFSFVHKALLVAALSGKSSKGIKPEKYWAKRNGAIYLSNGDAHIVKITANTVSLEDNGVDGVLFAMGCTLSPWDLTTPVDPFTSCRVFRNMNLRNAHGLDLLRVWTVFAVTSSLTKPVLVLAGMVRSGKTKVVYCLFELLGIYPRIDKPLEGGEENFWTSVDSGGLFCLDNVDTNVKWLADAVASASTGGKHEKRKLYSDSGIIRQEAKAVVVLTSANPSFAADLGLSDRIIVIRIEPREDTEDTSLSHEVLANRNTGLSWIAYTLSKVLADTVSVESNINKRHPDFASLAVKVGRAIGREEDVITALKTAEADKSSFNLENDEIGSLLMTLINTEGSFAGTATDLFNKLKGLEPTLEKRITSQRLGKKLKALWAHLKDVFTVEVKTAHGGINKYSITGRGGSGGDQPPVLGKVFLPPYVKTFEKTSLNPTTPTSSVPVTPKYKEILI